MWFILLLITIWGSTFIGVRRFNDTDLYAHAFVLTVLALVGRLVLFGLAPLGDGTSGESPEAINWFALTVMTIWISTAIGTGFVGEQNGYQWARYLTIMLGIGLVSTWDLQRIDMPWNWYPLSTMGLWALASIGAITTRQAGCYGMAFYVSALLGLIYLCVGYP